MTWHIPAPGSPYQTGFDDAKAGYDCVSPWRHSPHCRKRNELYLDGYLDGKESANEQRPA